MNVIRIDGKNKNSGFEIIPELGGMVHALEFEHKGECVPVLVSDKCDELSANPWFRGRFLFPFNDRIPAGKYSWQGREYSFPVNDPEAGDAIHGFLYREPMQCVRADNGKALLEYRYDGRYSYYPFSFSLFLEYLLADHAGSQRFSIKASVTNTGSGDMPWALGWHPYFSFPGERMADDYTLRLKAGCCAVCNDHLIPTGEFTDPAGPGADFSEQRKIGTAEYDTGFAGISWPAVLSDGRFRLEISAGGQVYEYVQLFIPPDRKSVAIEPVSALADSFNMPELGLRRLKAGESISGRINISFSVL